MAHDVGEFGLYELFQQAQACHATRAGADPLNVRLRPVYLELRMGFFSSRGRRTGTALPATADP
jgi:hypothetical protein